MAVEITTWVWNLPIKKNLKYVLVALGDYADKDGYCYPSIETLAIKCSITSVSVINSVNKLCKYGLLKKEKRYENGKKTSNSYCINFNLPKESLPKESLYKISLCKENMSTSKETLPNYLYMNRHITNNRTVNNMRAQEHKHKKKCAVKNKYSKEFEQFYKDYPRHRNKPRAYKAWLKINPDETLRKKIMGGVDTFKKYIAIKNVEEKYIPYPEKWLNGTQWEDDYDLTKDNKSTTQQKKSLSEQYADNLRGAWKEATA